ncbi:hypothetical protein BJX61DRAFT_501622 [Aspergillus egyptiacus]|nr:hypothetical protein BJX61DRAFT_501622 [Aspergillus egyptiacus]
MIPIPPKSKPTPFVLIDPDLRQIPITIITGLFGHACVPFFFVFGGSRKRGRRRGWGWDCALLELQIRLELFAEGGGWAVRMRGRGREAVLDELVVGGCCGHVCVCVCGGGDGGGGGGSWFRWGGCWVHII